MYLSKGIDIYTLFNKYCMEEYIVGIILLILGIPIGSLLARYTKEELRQGQKWFKLIVIVSLICAIVSAIIRNDFLLFSFLFVAIVTSRSLRR